MRSFGRINREFPDLWFRLLPGEDWQALGSAAIETHLPLLLSSNFALWGGLLRRTSTPLVVQATLEVESALDEKHACDIIQAHLIQALSALGTGEIAFYLLPVRKGWEEFQLSGALQAIQFAKEDKLVHGVGLLSLGHPMASLGLWQFHDAFDVIVTTEQESQSRLQPLATERRVASATFVPEFIDQGPTGDRAQIVTVDKAEHILFNFEKWNACRNPVLGPQ